MQIVINISENDYELIKEYGLITFPTVGKAIANGVILPKGHGRLGDLDKIGLTDFECFMCNGDFKEGLKMYIEKVDKAKTLVEADKEIDE